MSTGMKTNTGETFRKETDVTPLSIATTNFYVCDGTTLLMTKTVDKPNECYYSGDTIVFTITIQNNGIVATNGLFFTDTLDASVVPVSGTEYVVTTTSGVITQKTNPIKIKGINIPAGTTVTITITGKIA